MSSDKVLENISTTEEFDHRDLMNKESSNSGGHIARNLEKSKSGREYSRKLAPGRKRKRWFLLL